VTRAAPERERWRLERQLAVALASAMTLQAGAALIWAGTVGERVAQLERRAETAEPWGERLARIEERTIQIEAALRRIERRLGAPMSEGGVAEPEPRQ